MIREYDTPEIILVFICFILSNVEKHFVSNQHFVCLSRHDVGIVPYEPNVNLILANVALPRAKNRLWELTSNKFVRKLFTVLFVACELYKGTAMNKCFFSKLLRLRKIFSQAILQVGCCAVALPRAKNRLWKLTSNKFVRKLFTVLFAACELYKGTAINKCFFGKLLRLRKNFSQAILQVGCCAVALPRAKNRLWSFTSE